MRINVRTITQFNKIGRVAGVVAAGAGAAAHQAATDIRQEIHDRMDDPKTGIVYRIGGKLHQASAPGEAPAVLTGNLKASIQEEQVNATTWDVPAEGDEGQQMWEYGMQGPAGARPFLRPAADIVRAKYGTLVKIRVTDELGKL